MSKYTAIIYSERNYPEGDDVCLSQFPFADYYVENDRFFIVTDEGEKYTLVPIAWFNDNLHAKFLKKIEE